jgi:2,5-furandicarboxylate decarboxylase 1
VHALFLHHFHGQNYRDVYWAFGRLRSKLGRMMQPPYFPYAFSESGDFIGETPPERYYRRNAIPRN